MTSTLPKWLLPLLVAIAFAGFAVAVDVHNAEPQAAALVIIVSGFLIGATWPDRAWRWAVLLGLSIIIGDPIGERLGAKPTFGVRRWT